jgi:hypothetical protein
MAVYEEGAAAEKLRNSVAWQIWICKYIGPWSEYCMHSTTAKKLFEHHVLCLLSDVPLLWLDSWLSTVLLWPSPDSTSERFSCIQSRINIISLSLITLFYTILCTWSSFSSSSPSSCRLLGLFNSTFWLCAWYYRNCRSFGMCKYCHQLFSSYNAV